MPEVISLTALSPVFVQRTDDTHWREVQKIEEADGVEFLCPLCYLNNNKDRHGVHSVLCWEPNVPQSTSPKPGRWLMRGTGLSDLSLVANSSSVHVTEGCGAHFFVRNGQIEWA